MALPRNVPAGEGMAWGAAKTGGRWVTVAAMLLSGTAHAQTALPEITISAERPGAGRTIPDDGPAPQRAASEGTISAAEIQSRPVTRPGEVLEAIPGLIVTQHSGEGKANQYFLRGFNLDHGTDIAIHVDGMPVNMRSHGHGQGYADLNFLIPELVGGVWFRKGPYYADEGDFASAGSVRINYVDRLDRGLVQTTIGSYGHWRNLVAGSRALGEGTILAAIDTTIYRGPWQVSDDIRKFSGLLRYSQGTDTNGFSLTAMAYANRWTSTDQVPVRAVASGLIDRFGSLDPTDGGNAHRFSLSGRWSRSEADSASRVEGYVIRSGLNLWNNFTYFLDDPVRGDQFRQQDQRTLIGLNASHTWFGRLGTIPMETRIGLRRATTTSASACRARRIGTLSTQSATTACARPAPPSSSRPRGAGRLGPAPRPGPASTGTPPRWQATRPPIPAAPRRPSSAPSSASCSAPSTAPNCS